jgi:hypothetical protein
MVSLIPGSETRNRSSRGETVLGMLGIGDMSSVCQRIDNSFFGQKSDAQEGGALRIFEDNPQYVLIKAFPFPQSSLLSLLHTDYATSMTTRIWQPVICRVFFCAWN